MKITKNVLALLICLFILSGSVFSQKAWEKPFQKWSREDSIKILTSSPWAEMFQAEETSGAGIRQQRSEIQAARSAGGNPGSAARSFGFAPIIARLYSGLPVRQALVRLRQIQAGYDKMDEKKRAEFDQVNKGLMNCPICKNYYVVS